MPFVFSPWSHDDWDFIRNQIIHSSEARAISEAACLIEPMQNEEEESRQTEGKRLASTKRSSEEWFFSVLRSSFWDSLLPSALLNPNCRRRLNLSQPLKSSQML